jgi:hypothetical protein
MNLKIKVTQPTISSPKIPKSKKIIKLDPFKRTIRKNERRN